MTSSWSRPRKRSRLMKRRRSSRPLHQVQGRNLLSTESHYELSGPRPNGWNMQCGHRNMETGGLKPTVRIAHGKPIDRVLLVTSSVGSTMPGLRVGRRTSAPRSVAGASLLLTANSSSTDPLSRGSHRFAQRRFGSPSSASTSALMPVAQSHRSGRCQHRAGGQRTRLLIRPGRHLRGRRLHSALAGHGDAFSCRWRFR